MLVPVRRSITETSGKAFGDMPHTDGGLIEMAPVV